jgi:hypothetical protein
MIFFVLFILVDEPQFLQRKQISVSGSKSHLVFSGQFGEGNFRFLSRESGNYR